MVKGSVDSIESFGLVDGPGIRIVVFMAGCKLRCKYCHNPEMWMMKEFNYTPEELAKKIIRNKPYFMRNNGGVTFSGGEPLLQSEFIIEVCKILKKEKIHIALDTAGVGDYDEVLSYIDLVILDVKHISKDGYYDLTSSNMDEVLKFIDSLNKSGKKVWIRQVIVPGVMDNDDYLKGLCDFLMNIKNIEKIEFLPYHSMGKEKYRKLGINYPYDDIVDMDKNKCNELYQKFMLMYNDKVKQD